MLADAFPGDLFYLLLGLDADICRPIKRATLRDILDNLCRASDIGWSLFLVRYERGARFLALSAS